MNKFLIVNTRDGQNPNVLGAIYVNGVFTPQLVCSTDGHIPNSLINAMWSQVQVEPGVYNMQISDPDGKAYILVSTSTESGTICSLVAADAINSGSDYSLWSFPYPTRMILTYEQTQNASLSLDAGSYPNVMVYNFVSSVNQTWQFGTNLSNLQPYPPAH